MKYVIDDLLNGVFVEMAFVEANSPKQALEKLGYTNIKRDNFGDIVVRNYKASYVYKADRGDNNG